MSEPIRVLQVVTQMNRAGMESRLMDIYRHIDRNSVQFDFYTCRKTEGAYDSEIVNNGGTVYYEEPLSVGQALSIPGRFSLFLRMHREYGIVHCHLNQWCGLVLTGAKVAKVPIRIAHSRTSLEKCNLQNVIKNFLKLPVNYASTHRFAVSRKAGNWLFGKTTIHSGAATIWPNAINCDQFRYSAETRNQVRECLGLGDALTIIHVGNLRPEKNHEYLLRVFAEIRKRRIDSKLIIVGCDYLDGEVQNKAELLGLQQSILFLGVRSDIADLLQAGDIFVFPSIYEGFPGAVLEAQAAGLPCIISEKITEEVCLLPTTIQMSLKLSAEKWAEAVLSMRNIERKDTYEELKAAGYDIKTLAHDLTEFYLAAVSEKGKKNP